MAEATPIPAPATPAVARNGLLRTQSTNGKPSPFTVAVVQRVANATRMTKLTMNLRK